MTTMTLITAQISQPLHSVAATRLMEQRASAHLPPHTLMRRAGLATAQLALAIAPHARCIWVACGPGNNGGDGFEAARHLHQWGKAVVLTWTGLPTGKAAAPPDAEDARQRALAAGLQLASAPPAHFDLSIDALLGIGATLNLHRQDTEQLQRWLDLMHASGSPCLAIDVPTGLNADTGQNSGVNHSAESKTQNTINYVASQVCNTPATDSSCLKNSHFRHTLSLLTLKPGLFTAQGRDAAGQVWFDDLNTATDQTDVVESIAAPATAWLLGADLATAPPRANALQASHKGSFGDVAVVGGESLKTSHMAGAALLAARAALHTGAGRVFVCLLGEPTLTVDIDQPELMFRSWDALDVRSQVVVCGCGGGQMVKTVLPQLLSVDTPRLVLDADALNAIAADPALQALLKARQHTASVSTILTPHPLEAARLLGTTAAQVQADRLGAAQQLLALYGAVVVLKGSGTVVAALGHRVRINASGNALLATAGTGDVLAGMVGAYLAAGLDAFEAASGAVFAHGRKANVWAGSHPGRGLLASDLLR